MNGISCTLDELLKLRYLAHSLDVRQRKKVKTECQNSYASAFRGRGMDYSETRIYQPGDDVRAMHWRATAKTGKPHTKIFHEEKERPVYIVVDLNPNMFFGTRVAFKSVIAIKMAAILAWSAIKSGDRVGGLIFSESCQILMKPKPHSSGVVPLLKNLAIQSEKLSQSEDVCNYSSALHKLRHILKSGSLIYFLSDFYHLTQNDQNEFKYLAKHNEVINIFIYDVLEAQAPQKNCYLFADKLTKKILQIDTREKAINQQYSHIFEDRLQKLTDLRLPFHSVATHHDFERIRL